MLTVNIHEAKTHLSRLIERAAKGEPFIIAKAGKPMVKVTAIGTPVAGRVRRLGFMSGQIAVPEDFDRMGRTEIDFAATDETAARHALAAVGGREPRALVARRPRVARRPVECSRLQLGEFVGRRDQAGSRPPRFSGRSPTVASRAAG